MDAAPPWVSQGALPPGSCSQAHHLAAHTIGGPTLAPTGSATWWAAPAGAPQSSNWWPCICSRRLGFSKGGPSHSRPHCKWPLEAPFANKARCQMSQNLLGWWGNGMQTHMSSSALVQSKNHFWHRQSLLGCPSESTRRKG